MNEGNLQCFRRSRKWDRPPGESKLRRQIGLTLNRSPRSLDRVVVFRPGVTEESPRPPAQLGGHGRRAGSGRTGSGSQRWQPALQLRTRPSRTRAAASSVPQHIVSPPVKSAPTRFHLVHAASPEFPERLKSTRRVSHPPQMSAASLAHLWPCSINSGAPQDAR